MTNFGEGESQIVEFSSAFPNQGAFFLRTCPTGLMLEPVMRARQHRAPFVPDDLLMVQEADAEQPVEHFPSEFGSVPHVSYFKAWNQSEGVGPIGARVGRNGCFGVALGTVFHVARFRGPAAIQAGAIAPFNVELDSVRRICDHKERLALAKQPGNVSAAQHPMLDPPIATKPQITRPRNRIFR